MKRGTIVPYSLAALAALIALSAAWQTQAAPLSLLLLAAACAAFASLALALRAACYVLGVLLVLLGIPLLAAGGAYALLAGGLLLGCGATAPAPASDGDPHALA